MLAQYVEVVSMWRVTLTPVVINATRNVAFMVAGAGKAEMLRKVPSFTISAVKEAHREQMGLGPYCCGRPEHGL